MPLLYFVLVGDYQIIYVIFHLIYHVMYDGYIAQRFCGMIVR